MATAKLAEISIETGQTLVASHQLTDSGDHQTYSSASKPWSKFAGKEATILPNGLATGGAVVVGVSGTNNKIDVAALTCYLAGVLTTVNAAADETVTRAVTTDTHMINSVTITSAGAVAIIAGTDSTAFSEVRDAAGGPPLIPVGSIEIAQIRMSSNSAGKVTTDEIFAVAGQHMERYDYPTWTVDPIAGTIAFSAALPLSHTGAVTKRTFGKVYTPLYQKLEFADSFVPAEVTNSVSSTQVYGGVVGSESSSLGQCSFNAHMSSGHLDTVLGLAKDNQVILVKFQADRNKIPYSLTQGRIATKRTYPAGGSMVAAVTISAELPTVDFAS
jgi:hypothetical protein